MTENRFDLVCAEIKRLRKEVKDSIIELGNSESERIGLFNDLEVYDNILSFIDSMKKEPIISVWHNSNEEPQIGRNIVMCHNDHMYSGEYLGERFFGREKWTLMTDSKWAYVDELLKL